MARISSSSQAPQPIRARIPAILRRLDLPAQRPVHARQRGVLDSLISTVLSQNTSDVNSARAFAQLKAHFPNWEMVLEAPLSEIADTIRSGGLAEIKSARMKHILSRIKQDRGRLDLGFLADLPLEQARDYLISLPGVGRKTAAVVLLFSLGRPIFPVDTHVLRVSKRLGLIPPNTTMDRAHDLFAQVLKPAQMLPLHLALIKHGREVCVAGRPRCPICLLSDLCSRIGVTTISMPIARARR